jgi:Peptidase family M28
VPQPRTRGSPSRFVRTIRLHGRPLRQSSSQGLQFKQPNLQCTLAGESDSVIIIGAHYDSDERGTGAVDNWSGAALLLSLFQSLAGQPRRHTFVSVGFSGEEAGLIGSESFAWSIPKQDRARYHAMINLDTLGLGDTKVWVSHSDPKLFASLVFVARKLQLPIADVNVEEVGSTDSESFRSRNIPVLTMHSVTQQTLPLLHSKNDTVDSIDLASYYRTYRLAAVYLAYLDGKLDWVSRTGSHAGSSPTCSECVKPLAVDPTDVDRSPLVFSPPRQAASSPARHPNRAARFR